MLDDAGAVADRTAKSNAIVNSASPRRLIVAGPGTGKSYTFGRALLARGGAGLALTFIRSLVADMKRELGQLATVDTFHGYCKGRLHVVGGAGLGAGFRMYPELLDLVASDLTALGSECDRELLEERLHELDGGDGLLAKTLDIASYYSAVSFPDSIYRLVLHFDAHPEDVPTYPLVVVDEYQDFSRLETRLISHLAAKSYVLIAGDDDQALYVKKHAHPDFIRALATDGSFEVFNLPYCSRCTEVIVVGVQRVIERATQLHLLDGRLPKAFEPFPGKSTDSAAHPKIVHALCSVQRTDNPYMSRYVEEQIVGIPAADIALSFSEKHPTALVIGPSHFVKAVANYLQQKGHQVELRMSTPMEIDLADGYRYIAADPKSRLGWRIVHEMSPCEEIDAKLSDVLESDGDLDAAFCAACAADHGQIVDLVRRVLTDDQLTSEEEQRLRVRLGEEGDLKSRLAGWTDEETEIHFDEARPRIVCTSIIGSKGLSSEYVYVVGFNNGDFPRDPSAIKSTEVCELIVALSRTRKECHLVSCWRFGAARRSPSTFLDWLGDAVTHRRIDKSYWSS